MRLIHAAALLATAGLTSPVVQAHAAKSMTAAEVAGPMDPSVDGDLDGVLLWVDDPKPAPATSDSARVAPGPSERTAPAAPEVRQTPAGGETDKKTGDAKGRRSP